MLSFRLLVLLLTSLVAFFFVICGTRVLAVTNDVDVDVDVDGICFWGCVYLQGRVNCRRRHQSSHVLFCFVTGERTGQQVVAGSRSRAVVQTWAGGGALYCSNPGSLVVPRKVVVFAGWACMRFSRKRQINVRQIQQEDGFGVTDAW